MSETCYRYKARLKTENDEIADHLLRLTHNQSPSCAGCELIAVNYRVLNERRAITACEMVGLESRKP